MTKRKSRLTLTRLKPLFKIHVAGGKKYRFNTVSSVMGMLTFIAKAMNDEIKLIC